MSEFHVRVVKIGSIEKHPDADNLSLTLIDGGYPCIFKTGDFKEGELACYLPVDSIVPNEPEYAFLQGNNRIKAKKLRGIFSMGMLMPYELAIKKIVHKLDAIVEIPKEDDNIQELLGIKKWDPTYYSNSDPNRVKIISGNSIPSPEFFPEYTDIEGMRKYQNDIRKTFQLDEEVILTEKVHGMNARFGYHEEQMYAGSHHFFKKRPAEGEAVNDWWRVVQENNLEEICKRHPGFGFYGEIYGKVQKGFDYGAPGLLKVRMFDILNLTTRKYLDYDEYVKICTDEGLEMTPILYRGPWKDELKALSDGPTTIPGASHIREGFVARLAKERWDLKLGRVILKLVGEAYLIKAGKKE